MKDYCFVLFLILVSYSCKSQDRFEYKENGLVPNYIVMEIDTLSQSALYNRCYRWIQETYKNPSEVIKMQIENEKIRFEGYSKAITYMNAIGTKNYYDAMYTIEVSFKEGRFKFDPVSLTLYTNNYVPIDWLDIDYGKPIFKNNGGVRGMYRNFPTDIGDFFTGLMLDLASYQIVDNVEDDW